jgi:hypothetical protein
MCRTASDWPRRRRNAPAVSQAKGRSRPLYLWHTVVPTGTRIGKDLRIDSLLATDSVAVSGVQSASIPEPSIPRRNSVRERSDVLDSEVSLRLSLVTRTWFTPFSHLSNAVRESDAVAVAHKAGYRSTPAGRVRLAGAACSKWCYTMRPLFGQPCAVRCGNRAP